MTRYSKKSMSHDIIGNNSRLQSIEQFPYSPASDLRDICAFHRVNTEFHWLYPQLFAEQLQQVEVLHPEAPSFCWEVLLHGFVRYLTVNEIPW